MFTTSERTDLREWLVALAGAALLGSTAPGREDRWSDIDITLRLTPGDEPVSVADSWGAGLRERVEPVAHLDLWSNGALYRVFLLPNTLQVDLSFWLYNMFRAYGPKFRLVFGEANENAHQPAASTNSVLGMAWLHALHARPSLARGRVWQALYMINGARDHVVELGRRRHGLPAAQGRGVDELPPDVRASLTRTLPQTTDGAELRRA